MRHLLKTLLPAPLLTSLRQRRAARDRARLMRAWEGMRGSVHPAKGPAEARLLVVPSDLARITGALGDDAMITAALEQARARLGPVEVDMAGLPRAAGVIAAKGFRHVPLPAAAELPAALAALFAERRYAAVVVLGADILDGYYNPAGALTRLVAADLAARSGLPVTVLGASFNATPAPVLKPAFDALHPGVALHMRDAVSLERLERFTTARARLVADSAFTLTPGTADPRAAEWIAAEKAAGRTVLGLNTHPMLIRGATPAQVDRMIRATVAAVTGADADRPLSWVLIPHDYRGDLGDARCLRPVQDALEAEGVRSLYLDGTHRAADLKALAGLTDGVVTGRMHLAIAALGMGVPVLSLTYQDKFEGLYRHFGLPEKLLLPPAIFDDPGALAAALERFAADLPGLTAQVAERRPAIRELAERNFEVMGPRRA